MTAPLKVFVIAGEESGDILGGAILHALQSLSGRSLEVRGIGGTALTSAGLTHSLIDMHELAVMGIVEILPKISFFKRVIAETTAAVEAFQPDILLTIDSPDFCFRVQRAVHANAKAPHTKHIHVVAPSVWAWRPGRAKKIAAFLDGLICLLPFEPPYFTAHNLPAVAIGHPAINSPLTYTVGGPLREHLGLRQRDILLGVYPGSRAGVIKRHAPLFRAAIAKLAATYPDLQVIVPTFPRYESLLNSIFANLPVSVHVVTDPALKYQAMKANNIALAASGTVGLELAVANVPHVVAYKTGWLTGVIARMLIKTPFVHLANIILNKPVVPELLQARATPALLAKELGDLINYPARSAKQQMDFALVRKAMGEGAEAKPAEQAAAFILSRLSAP